jgi:hypothetical protein
VDAESPAAIGVPFANCLACHWSAIRSGEDRKEVCAVGGGQRTETVVADVNLDVLRFAALRFGEQDENLAEIWRWPMPGRCESLLSIRVEYHVCRWPGSIAAGQHGFLVQDHIGPRHLELILDGVDGLSATGCRSHSSLLVALLLGMSSSHRAIKTRLLVQPTFIG